MATEKSYTEEIECSFCKHKVIMEQLQSIKIREEEDINDTTTIICWQIIQCPACQKTLLREGHWNDTFDEGSESNYKIIYPQPSPERKNINVLPKAIREAYISA